jgi:predicted enzyme related to lactoylglutathione lyase
MPVIVVRAVTGPGPAPGAETAAPVSVSGGVHHRLMSDVPTVSIRFELVALDTPDPAGLASFYSRLLGWQVERTEPDWIRIRAGDSGPVLAFQLAPDHQPPSWPDPAVPQQIHLDFAVDDLAAASAYAVSLGARRVSGPEVTEDFVVLLDPSGHPFCLCD